MAKTKDVLTAGIVAIVIYHARMAPDHAMTDDQNFLARHWAFQESNIVASSGKAL